MWVGVSALYAIKWHDVVWYRPHMIGQIKFYSFYVAAVVSVLVDVTFQLKYIVETSLICITCYLYLKELFRTCK